jgi:hypothetical protein
MVNIGPTLVACQELGMNPIAMIYTNKLTLTVKIAMDDKCISLSAGIRHAQSLIQNHVRAYIHRKMINLAAEA